MYTIKTFLCCCVKRSIRASVCKGHRLKGTNNLHITNIFLKKIKINNFDIKLASRRISG